MKKALAILVVFALSFCFLEAASDQYFTKNQIILTDNGIYINLDGNLIATESIAYFGNGLYQCDQPYYGSCGRCGWPRDKNGKCTNQNCTGYGPPDRD